ncbi:hypothetical protein KGQ19_08725 [Catenulispora sp. NL8]|uniref:Uncharacterized protein n=1 Tax=Catenulispora pinistramenti TaxID=2705254 RepID=A0ABS5KLN9_9ACTN|nr:hypothetical protein [Catenulispora pinistramenti]MBS2546951.1 hypothetical protein [Catenulispora pinistramenti]
MAAPSASGAVLRDLLRAGLPLSDYASVDPVLLDLRGVVARAAWPDDPASRLRALDSLLRWQLARFSHHRLAVPARMLFGAAPETSGLTLTERREKAAASADYEVHHFRKRVEPEICERLADLLNADSEDLRSRAIPPALGQARRPLRLPADVFAWEAAEHEQALSSLWSGVYALRAALLAAAVASGTGGPDSTQATDAARTALWRLAQTLRAAAAYVTAYGPSVLGADPPTEPEELALLAGWYPAVSDDLAAALAAGAAQSEQPELFWAAVQTSPAATAADAWCTELAASAAPAEQGVS